MKKNVLMKAVALILALCLAALMPLSVVAAELTYYPVIYLPGMDESVLYENPNKTSSKIAFGVNDSSENGFLSSAVNIVGSLAAGGIGVSSNSAALNAVVAGLVNIFDDIACKDNGTSRNPDVSTWYYPLSLDNYQGEEIDNAMLEKIAECSGGRISTKDIYVCTTDWRLDPFDNAEQLMNYIDMVIAATGAKKVTLLCAGTGGVAAETYLYEYSSHAKENVDSVTFLNCPLTGNANVGELMSGKLYQTAGDADGLINLISIIKGDTRTEAFTNYFQEDPNGLFTGIFKSIYGEGAFSSLLSAFTKILISTIIKNESSLGGSYNTFVVKNQTVLYESVFKKYLRNMPGVWALVPDEYYDDAIEYMFGEETINYELYDKITAYRDVIKNLDETLGDAKNDGIKVYVVAGYDTQNLPLTVSLDAESDGIVTTRHASAGGTTEECGINWTGFDTCTNAYHNHLEPTGIIDASTCALPENTWFVKGLSHLSYTDDSCAAFLIWLMTSDVQRTVWDNVTYTQYLRYNKYAEQSLSAFTDAGSYMLYGDIDVNGKVEVADARRALRFAIGLDPLPRKELCAAIDVDGDYYITVEDARYILRYALELDKSFPVEK